MAGASKHRLRALARRGSACVLAPPGACRRARHPALVFCPILFLSLIVLPVLASAWASPATVNSLSPAGTRFLAQAAPAAPATLTTPAPALHRRAESQALAERDTETLSHGRTTLPSEASGEYLLGENGESVEIDLQSDRLSGYVSRFGDRLSDQGEPLTFFFATASLSGRHLSFLTRQVHGVWYSFAGTIVHGEARSREQQGYYRLEGRLVLHDAMNRTEQARDVSLPLAREYSGPAS